MKVRKLRHMPRQGLHRPFVAINQRRRGHLDQIAEHQALFDQAFHPRPSRYRFFAASALCISRTMLEIAASSDLSA